MEILVLNPPFKTEFGRFSRTSRSPAVTKSGTIYFPFWLSYAVGVLDKEKKFDISFIDACAANISEDELYKKVRAHNFKLIVVDTSTPSIYNDLKIAGNLKEIFPDSIVTLVGTHPSALPEETLKLDRRIDCIAIGEYDYTIKDLAYAVLNKKDISAVNGLVIRKGDRFIKTPQKEPIGNLDELPFVTRVYEKYLNIKDYFFTASLYPMVMLITGRGCPFHCFFCVYPQVFHSRKYRFRSPENVAEEFLYIQKNFPFVKEIGIEDDTFTANIPRARRICELLIERKSKIKWYCNVRVNLDHETMRLMRKAGCILVTVGFESASNRILKNIKKNITREDIKRFCSDVKRAGILVHGCFMAGFPGETHKDLEETLEFAKMLNTDTMQFYPLIPYPGTEAYKWAIENNFLESDSFDQWCTPDGEHNCVIRNEKLSREEIMDFCDRAVKEYYFRPRYIAKKLGSFMRRPEDIVRTLKSFSIFIKSLRREKCRL